RSGAIGTRSLIFWPSAIVPSMLVTVEFQRGISAALVIRDQILSGAALMLIAIAYCKLKVLRVVWARPSGWVVGCIFCHLDWSYLCSARTDAQMFFFQRGPALKAARRLGR